MRRLIALLLFTSALRGDNIAVLPFFNESKLPNLDWIGESVSENIRETLASQGLLVLSREDRVEVFRRLSIRPNALLTHASVLKIGETLDAAQMVFGHFLFSPDPANSQSKGSLKLVGSLLDLKNLKQGPEFQTVGPVENLSVLQTHLAWQLLKYLAPKAAPSEEEFGRARPPVRVDAVENYIRGLLAPDADRKQKLFTQASRLDEGFSEPCFQLGRIFFQKKEYRSAAQWLARVNRADSHYMEALFLTGLAHYYQGNYDTAANQFHQVAALVPLNEVYNDLGAAQSRRNLPDAMENFKKALEGDEADADYWFNVGYWLWKAGKFDEAAQKFRAVLDRTQYDAEAMSLLGRCLKREGPRPVELRPAEGRERVKLNFELAAFRQLQAEMGVKK